MMNSHKRVLGLIGGICLIGAWILWLGLQPAAASQERPIIKHGTLAVMVEQTDTAVAETLDLTATFNGYALEQLRWDDNMGFHYATITIGVPVNNFEGLLQALKRLGMVQNESITGQDVVDEAIDLQSQLDNLYETQDRMRSFLEIASGVTETLKVHSELVTIESEIGTLQGRLNYLDNRSDAATITIDIVPFIPTVAPTATATATPTATPTPLPTPQNWRPGDTAQIASVRLQETAQNTADFLIFRLIICGPWLLGLSVAVWFWRRVYFRLRR
jgi:hypothetical protein